MPWATPYSPCIQLGILKSHMDSVLGDRIQSRCHSAHLGIRLLSPEATASAMPFDEHAYMLLCRRARAPESAEMEATFAPAGLGAQETHIRQAGGLHIDSEESQRAEPRDEGLP